MPMTSSQYSSLYIPMAMHNLLTLYFTFVLIRGVPWDRDQNIQSHNTLRSYLPTIGLTFSGHRVLYHWFCYKKTGSLKNKRMSYKVRLRFDVEAVEVWRVSCSLLVSELLCPDSESLLELSMLLASQTA